MVVVAAAQRRQLGDRRAAELAAPDAPACSSSRPRCFRSVRNAAIGWSHCVGQLAVLRFARSSWLSHGWPAPLQTWTKRTPRSSSRRVISSCRPCVPGAVQLADRLRLAADVEGVGRLGLHPVGQLERLDAGFELRRRRRGRARCCALSAATRSSCSRCSASGSSRVADVLDQLVDVGVLGVDVGALVGAGQEGGAPVLRGRRSGSRRGTWR